MTVQQNTEQVKCESGFRANADRTGCECKFSDIMQTVGPLMLFMIYYYPYTAIPPPLSIEVPSEVDRSWFTVNADSNQYTVDIGREFQVLCISSGEHSGTVTWMRVDNNGGQFAVAKACLETPHDYVIDKVFHTKLSLTHSLNN